jgi:hypothetical protein
MLFGVYIAAIPLSLLLALSVLLIWYWDTDDAAVAPGDEQRESTDVQASSDTALEQKLNEDTQSARSGAKIKRRFWKYTVVVVVSPIICLGSRFIINRWKLFGSSDYADLIIFLVVVITWILLIWGLLSISKILLFNRARTNFPRWSTLLGVVAGVLMVLCALSPLPLILPSGCGNARSPISVPPNAFDVSQTIQFAFEDIAPFKVSEQYKIEPKSHFAITAVREIESGAITQSQIDQSEMFESGRFEDSPLETMQLKQHRDLPATVENLGLLRSKMTFSPPEVTLVVRDLESPLDDLAGPDEQASRSTARLMPFPTSRALNFSSTIKIDLPKNAYLASAPKGELVPLPDKDQLTITISKPESIELYYLRRARFKILTGLLGQSSNHDIAIGALAALFWPVVLILIGKFHKTLADRVMAAFSTLFGRKKKPKVGFV